MQLAEYEAKKRVIHIMARDKLKHLADIFAHSNSSVKTGDMATDHMGTIMVERVRTERSSITKKPSCVYSGPCYTKQGKPFKNGECRDVYQVNLLTD